MGFPYPSKPTLLLLLLLLAAGVVECMYTYDCEHAAQSDTEYEYNVNQALTYLEDNTGFWTSLNTQYPPDYPKVYARSYCYLEPCRECLRVAGKSLLRYCKGRVFGSAQVNGTGTCSLYYSNYPFSN